MQAQHETSAVVVGVTKGLIRRRFLWPFPVIGVGVGVGTLLWAKSLLSASSDVRGRPTSAVAAQAEFFMLFRYGFICVALFCGLSIFMCGRALRAIIFLCGPPHWLRTWRCLGLYRFFGIIACIAVAGLGYFNITTYYRLHMWFSAVYLFAYWSMAVFLYISLATMRAQGVWLPRWGVWFWLLTLFLLGAAMGSFSAAKLFYNSAVSNGQCDDCLYWEGVVQDFTISCQILSVGCSFPFLGWDTVQEVRQHWDLRLRVLSKAAPKPKLLGMPNPYSNLPANFQI
mmetsp:Transcript_13029/g.30052  ORF Transcript_13029/g.30052 Transcript_13029/m.30052 type:complete len:284 (-) Transcript_13029:152-1003(-)